MSKQGFAQLEKRCRRYLTVAFVPLEIRRRLRLRFLTGFGNLSLTGVTLLEILIVIIIIGILAALALPNYIGTREATLDKEAKANLKLIQAAEKIYKIEIGFYYPLSGIAGTANINNYLKLILPLGPSWDYSIVGTNTGTGRATRTSDSRTWTLTISNDEPTSP